MPDVKHVTVILANPAGDDDVGAVTFGHYVLDGKKLTLTDSKGTPVRRAYGELVERTLEDGQDADVVARVMTRSFRQHVSGQNDFHRRLVYPKKGVA
jgi:hypothetical protein